MERIKQLREHPLTQLISFDDVNNVFKVLNEETNRKSKCPGITPLLRQAFYPTYEYKHLKNQVSSGATSMTDGIERGKIVHKQLEDIFNLTANTFKELYKSKDLHDKTYQAVISLRAQRMSCRIAEFPIYSPFGKFATKIDAVCVNENDELIIIDWKCGMDAYITRGSGMMESPFELFSDCPLHQGFAQLLMEVNMLRLHYGVKVDRAYIVQMKQEDVTDWYELPQEWMNYKDRANEILCITTLDNREQQNKDLRIKIRQKAIDNRRKNAKAAKERSNNQPNTSTHSRSKDIKLFPSSRGNDRSTSKKVGKARTKGGST